MRGIGRGGSLVIVSIRGVVGMTKGSVKHDMRQSGSGMTGNVTGSAKVCDSEG